MSERQHLAFLILAPVNGSQSSSTQAYGDFTLTLAVVEGLEAAVRMTRDLSAQGVTAIELSASFGDEGLAAIQGAAGPGVRVGRVHYGPHPE